MAEHSHNSMRTGYEEKFKLAVPIYVVKIEIYRRFLCCCHIYDSLFIPFKRGPNKPLSPKPPWMLDKPEVLAAVTEQPWYLPWEFDTVGNKVESNLGSSSGWAFELSLGSFHP